MKATHFDYVAASTPEEAVAALKDADGAGKVIAGGQSLVPLLNMRLARPTLLVDINNLNKGDILVNSDWMSVGATVRQSKLEKHLYKATPGSLVAKCLPYIGHSQTRNRGTVVGSVVHADPSAELPLAAWVLDAEVELFGEEGPRFVPVQDLYFGYMMTAIEPTEVALSVRFRQASRQGLVGSGFAEVARRHGDFAIAAAACEVVLGNDEEIREIRFGLGGVHATPWRVTELEEQARGQRMTDDFIKEFVKLASADLDPDGDLNATSAYRKHLARVLGARALKSAWADAINAEQTIAATGTSAVTSKSATTSSPEATAVNQSFNPQSASKTSDQKEARP